MGEYLHSKFGILMRKKLAKKYGLTYDEEVGVWEITIGGKKVEVEHLDHKEHADVGEEAGYKEDFFLQFRYRKQIYAGTGVSSYTYKMESLKEEMEKYKELVEQGGKLTSLYTWEW